MNNHALKIADHESQLPKWEIDEEIKEDTKKRYVKAFKSLLNKAERSANGVSLHEAIFNAICDTEKKNTYYFRVAAFKFHLSNCLNRSWSDKSTNVDCLRQTEKLITSNAGQCPIPNPRRRHSKRKDIRNLPENWRISIFLEMPRYRLQYLVMALTGCRPEELRKGISIQKTDSEVKFTIAGAKVKETQGQPWRTLTYALDEHDLNPLLHHFLIEYSYSNHPDRVQISDKGSFAGVIRRIGKKIFPKHALSPYCLRHQAASDFKKSLSPDDVSRALGHCVSRTRSCYGQSNMSKGSTGLAPSRVVAMRSIKQTGSLNISTRRSRPRF